MSREDYNKEQKPKENETRDKSREEYPRQEEDSWEQEGEYLDFSGEEAGSHISEQEMKDLCRQNICPDCELLREQKNQALKAIADSENYKKRLAREKEEYCKYAVSSFIEEVIPVIDNLELALEHGRKNEACKDLAQGVEMTLNLFYQVLEKNNLKQVGSEGEDFDPNFHEAMAQQEREDMDEGKICQVMQKGYLLGDRLVRPAKVLVSKQCSPEKNE
ncbi:GrpE protein [Desulfonatronospira thiodismutans ASO3-1]|uniref:Protein GrpE n=1 Tax=Desulfonatronospira thiodismutans ASO3-1 TaxID=555779 RepID=D6SMV2_9BACT|nr:MULTISPECIES: nucleotide exchange factor GrpE [Desulfonatronospira]EFI36013.1 GrpE protein [Desulfonatronospira thiodismutans ASO3-1]RQD73784.1 MAG: nucleotide exchange factor GrpE [Desulfonatronospira sp. MSAO_Bac3]